MPESRQSDSPRRCLGCNYQLRGLPENRCPECGRPFDPDDPFTIKMARPLGPSAADGFKTTGWPAAIAATLIMMLTLISFTPPEPYFEILMWSTLGWMCLGLYWVLRLFLSIGIGIRYRQPIIGDWRYWLRWSVLPLIGAVTFLTVRTDIPMHVAFWVSKPSMQAVVDEILAGGKVAEPSRLGAFPISEIDYYYCPAHSGWWHRLFCADSGWISFTVGGSGAFDLTWAGFAYDRTGNRDPGNTGNTPGYTHITGNWYYFVDGR